MKTKLPVLLIALLSVVLSACNSTKECELNNIGYIEVDNSKSDPYEIYVEGEYFGFVNPKSRSYKRSLSPGRYKVKVLQYSGYLVYPTKIERSVVIYQCESTVFSF